MGVDTRFGHTICFFSVATATISGMVVVKQRFPRQSYANRVAGVAEDMAEWVPGLLEFARGKDSWMRDDREVEKAEARSAAIQDVVAELQELAIRITAIR